MARHVVPLPQSLQWRAFTLAEARESDVTEATLRHSRFDRPHHGVRQLREAPENSTAHSTQQSPQSLQSLQSPREALRKAAHSYSLLLRPEEAFSHSTALILFGAPIRVSGELHVTIHSSKFTSADPSVDSSAGSSAPSSTHTSVNPARGRNVIGHRCADPFEIAWTPDGLPCVPYFIALKQSASELAARELVVAIDALLVQRFPRTSLKQHQQGAAALLDKLRQHARELRGHGMPRLRAALGLARYGAESRMETLVRLEMAAVGIQDLELQGQVYDNSGAWVGRFDFVDRRGKRIIEYDGEQHRLDRGQYLKDQERLDRAWAAGYRVRRLGKEDLSDDRLEDTRRRLCEFLDRAPKRTPVQLGRFLAER